MTQRPPAHFGKRNVRKWLSVYFYLIGGFDSTSDSRRLIYGLSSPVGASIVKDKDRVISGYRFQEFFPLSLTNHRLPARD